MRVDEIMTPAALVDLDKLARNIYLMAEIAKEAGVKLRPHIKTHKIPEIAKMQMEAGAVGVTCAKVSEAEVMAGAGIRDLLIAYPVVGEPQIEKALDLIEVHQCRVTIGFDSTYGAEKIDAAARRRGTVVPLYMIINTGGERDGVLPGQEALELARRVAALEHVRIRGIMTHEGHVYQAKNEAELLELARAAGRKMVETAELLRQSGIPVEEVSMGSTPASRIGAAVPGVTEWRPGTYVFNDVRELDLVTPPEECAFTILSTVVSHPAPNRFILDAGSKTLTSEISGRRGFGYIKEAPSAVIDRLSEEHGVVIADDPNALRIGQRVEIIPNHICPVVNLMDYVYAVRDGEVAAKWTVAARGKIV
jgi:D-serine deaminase-like pyridoxal phosphate-dependent protein